MDVDVVLAGEELVLAVVDIILSGEVPVSVTLTQSTVVVKSPLATRVCRDQRRVKKGRHGVDRTVTTTHNVWCRITLMTCTSDFRCVSKFSSEIRLRDWI